MRNFAPLAALVSALIALGWARTGVSEDDREFIFTDDEGHLVLRLVAAGRGELGPVQRNEVLNQELSVMVHDRMHADIRFESEPLDADWASEMELRVRHILGDAATRFSDLEVECRTSTCRILLEQTTRLTISEHQQQLEQLQAVIENYIGNDPASFDPGFVMAGYEQASQTPMIKVFLQRASGY